MKFADLTRPPLSNPGCEVKKVYINTFIIDTEHVQENVIKNVPTSANSTTYTDTNHINGGQPPCFGRIYSIRSFITIQIHLFVIPQELPTIQFR